MTNKEAHALGRVYGYVQTIISLHAKKDVDVPYASHRPFSSMADMIRRANAFHALTDADNQWIGSVLEDVDVPEDSAAEPVQPLPIQGSWLIGYQTGKVECYKIFQQEKLSEP